MLIKVFFLEKFVYFLKLFNYRAFVHSDSSIVNSQQNTFIRLMVPDEGFKG